MLLCASAGGVFIAREPALPRRHNRLATGRAAALCLGLHAELLALSAALSELRRALAQRAVLCQTRRERAVRGGQLFGRRQWRDGAAARLRPGKTAVEPVQRRAAAHR